jgi:hypothetical protein
MTGTKGIPTAGRAGAGTQGRTQAVIQVQYSYPNG